MLALHFFSRLNLLILTTAAKLKRHQASASFLDEFLKIPNAVPQDNFYLIHFLRRFAESSNTVSRVWKQHWEPINPAGGPVSAL